MKITDDMLDAVSIEISYEIKLIALNGDDAVYALIYDDGERIELSSHTEAYVHVEGRRNTLRVKAIAALIIEEAAKVGQQAALERFGSFYVKDAKRSAFISLDAEAAIDAIRAMKVEG